LANITNKLLKPRISISCESNAFWSFGVYSFPNNLDDLKVRSAIRHSGNWNGIKAIHLVTPSKIKNLKLSDNRLEVWPRNRETSLFQILNVENVNFEEIWFEFEYFDGLFDATQVQLEAVLDENV